MNEKLPLLYEVAVRGGSWPLTEELEELYARSKIDPNDLDGELVTQASLYAYWATIAAESDFEADAAQRQVDVTEAQLAIEFRAAGQPATLISTLVKGDARYVEVIETLHVCKRNTAIFKAMTRMLEHRREMLTVLVRREGKDFDASRNAI